MTQPKDRRQQLREKNRLALIEATLDCVAELGIARTSVSTIIERAGLSRGMIHLHFESKDKLLEAAVAHAGITYYAQLDKLLAQAGPSPQETIEAIIRSDLGEAVLNRRSVSIWYAFRGEARERETFRQHSDTRDVRMSTLASGALLEMLRSEGVAEAEPLARDTADGVLAMLEGIWTDYLLHPDGFDRNRAARLCFRYMQAVLPQYFNADGAVLPMARKVGTA
ncbi:TetR family transcriptional regulator C-terminal domain-containing protein [Roseovarius sp. 2305UL8-3]|uniref:TetR family transcriptional regulator C-terminal domain-containing protein n=1 Tax=Roseovarius conchicola TaxID=3121636 RepID=UPI0035291C9F